MGRQSLRARAGRKTGGIAAIEAGRAAAIEQMPPALLAKLGELEQSINDMRETNLRYYYRVGQTCMDIQQNPATYVGHDGTSGLRLLEAALSTQARTLRACVRFVEHFSEAELDDLIRLEHRTTKFRLHWGHVRYLLTVEDRQDRSNWSRQAVQNGWDPDALHAAIKKRYRRRGGHGRSHAVPEGLASQLGQFLKYSQTWRDKHEQVWVGGEHNILSRLADMPPDDVTAETIDATTDLLATLRTMQDMVEADVSQLERVCRYQQEVLSRRQSRAVASPAAAESSPESSRGGRARERDLAVSPAARSSAVPRRRSVQPVT